MKTFCIYHRVDFDGKCSAAIILRKYPDAILVPYQYGDDLDLEQFRGHRVIMVDCSLQPFDRMVELAEMCEQLVWIDHHKTAIEEYGDLSVSSSLMNAVIVLDSTQAGCELTWAWAFPGREQPRAVHLLGRYDVWDLYTTEVMQFQYGMRQNDWSPDSAQWQWLLAANESTRLVGDTIKDGALILAYVETHNESLCNSAFEATLDGLRCICVNVPRANSHVFDSVWDPEKHDAMLAFSNWNNRNWTVSLYTHKADVDVGAIAKARGGGGHQKAAGFQCQQLPEVLCPSTRVGT